MAEADGGFPFVHARRVRWGEADPARIAYTPRFLDFAVDAIEAFFQDRLGVGFYEMTVDRGIGTPFVRVEIDFRSPLTPRDVLETEVRLVRLGGGSLTFAVRGRAGARLAFEGRLTCAFVEGAFVEGSPGKEGAELRPVQVPEAFRARLAADAAFARGDGPDGT